LQNTVFPDALQQLRQIVFCGAKDSKKPVLGLGAAALWLRSGYGWYGDWAVGLGAGIVGTVTGLWAWERG